MLKKLKVTLFIIGIVTGMWNKEAFCNSENFCYVPKVLFTIPYGVGDGYCVAIGVDSFGDDHGPSSFWVDKDGCIYIGDSLNGKIKKFSKDGKLIFATERKFHIGCSFVVDDKGNIFISTDVLNRITKFDNNGRFIYHIPYDEMDCPEKARKAPPLEAMEIPSFKRPALIDTQGNKYEVHYENLYEKNKDKKIIVSIYDKTGNHSGNFTIFSTSSKQAFQSPPQGTSSHISLPDYQGLYEGGIGIREVDGQGNLYGVGSKKRDKPIILKNIPVAPPEGVFDFTINYDDIIYKYNSKGEFIIQISYPSPSWGVGENSVVDKDGNIYCLQSHKDGMDVVKYEWKPTKVMRY